MSAAAETNGSLAMATRFRIKAVGPGAEPGATGPRKEEDADKGLVVRIVHEHRDMSATLNPSSLPLARSTSVVPELRWPVAITSRGDRRMSTQDCILTLASGESLKPRWSVR